MRNDSVDSPLNLNIRQELSQSRFFAHDEWRVSHAAVLNIGAMFEKDGMGHANTSPRVSLNYHLTPQHTVRVGTSVAYRSPATVEEKANMPGEYLSLGGLRPEKIHSKEIGYLGEFKSLGLTVDAKAFYDKLSDIVFVDPLGALKPYSFRNMVGSTERGIESTIKYRWQDRNSLIFSYARLSVDCTITGTFSQAAAMFITVPILQSYVNGCARNGPWNSGSILLTQQVKNDIQFSAGYYHQGPLPILNTSEATVMRRVDMRIAKSLGKSEMYSGGEIAFVLQNAFQSGYAEFSTAPQTNFIKKFNKRAYLTATLNF